MIARSLSIGILCSVWVYAQTSGGGGGPVLPAQPGTQAAQAPPVKAEDKCTVEGLVVNALSGEPLRKAHLILQKAGGNPMESKSYGTVSDAAGHFLIEKIEPGTYMFTAQRNGFVNMSYGSKKPSPMGQMGTPLTLSPKQALKGVTFKLLPHAVVSGRVVDEDGEPVSGVGIKCSKYQWMNGKKGLAAMGYGSTNDKGEYRAFGLPPGKYYVSATMRNNNYQWGPVEVRSDASANETYAETYYPSALSAANAVPVDVPAGGEITAIDMKLVRMRAVQVSGTVVGSPTPSRPSFIMFAPKDSGAFNWDAVKQLSTDAKGDFIIRGVVPGSYTLTANAMGEDRNQMTAFAQIEVGDSNVEGVQVAFGTGATLTGVIVVDGKSDFGDLKGKMQGVGLHPIDNVMFFGGAQGEPKEDGTFTLRNVPAGRLRLNVWGLPEEYYVKTIRFGPTTLEGDVLDFSKGATSGELTVTVSPNGAHVEGSVQDEDHKPMPGSVVVAIPEQRDRTSLFRVAAADQNGHFVLKGITPGKYKLFAWDEVEPGATDDPEFLKPFEERGEAVEFKESDKLSKDLKLIITDELAARQKAAEKK